MARSRRESHHSDGITDAKKPATDFCNKIGQKRTSGLGLHPSENEVLFRYSTIHIEHLFISPAC